MCKKYFSTLYKDKFAPLLSQYRRNFSVGNMNKKGHFKFRYNILQNCRNIFFHYKYSVTFRLLEVKLCLLTYVMINVNKA